MVGYHSNFTYSRKNFLVIIEKFRVWLYFHSHFKTLYILEFNRQYTEFYKMQDIKGVSCKKLDHYSWHKYLLHITVWFFKEAALYFIFSCYLKSEIINLFLHILRTLSDSFIILNYNDRVKHKKQENILLHSVYPCEGLKQCTMECYLV